MPQIKSAIKRVAVTKTKNLRNRMIKSSLSTTVKKFHSAVAEGSAQGVESNLRKAVAAFDKAGAKGILHKNAVNRKKAQLAKKRVAAQ